MDILSTLKTIRMIIVDSLLPQERKETYLNRLNKIEQREKDSNVYVGIVGEFSSGKSTLINALIGADYFVTNALQGTTTVVTAIKYADSINLELKYKNGKSLKYSNGKLALLEKYLPKEYGALSLGEKMKLKAVDWFGGNKKDEMLLRIFDVVTTSDEVAEELDEVVVYHPSEFLKNGIVILDTPGTDSLNPNHQLITERAIAEKCDLAMVVIPSNKPLSTTLSDFVENNLEACKDKCYFLITKVELLRKEVERRSLIKGVNTRLDAFLGIEDPKTLLAPTLLSLEERNIIERTGLLEHLSDEERLLLSSEFNLDISDMFGEIAKDKKSTINATLTNFIKSLNDDLVQELTNRQNQLKSELDSLKRLRTIPLAQFMSNYFLKEEFSDNFSYVEARLQNNWYTKHVDFEKYINSKIDLASSKDETQGIMGQEDTRDYGQSCFLDCYNIFYSELCGLKLFYEASFEKFKSSFTDTFSLQALDFTFKLKINSSWQRGYNSRFYKWNLTTGLLRAFKKLQSIKQEMKKEVRLKLEKSFGKMQNYYMVKITESNNSLNRQMEKIKPLFISKYDRIIKKRIAEEREKEQLLNSQISQLQKSIEELSSL